jgi:hypothetical protein
MRRQCVSVLVVWSAALSSLAFAQTSTGTPNDTRAGTLAAAREAKATKIAPPQRSGLDSKLYWYDNQYVLSKLLAGWHGFHIAGGSFPAGAGFKFGVGFDQAFGASDPDPDRPNRASVTARAAISTRGYKRVGAGLDFRNLGGGGFDISLRSQYYEFPQEDFFGLGPDSLKANRTDYRLDSFDTGIIAAWKPVRIVELGAGLSYLAPRIDSGTDSRFPSTELVFAPSTLPGFLAQPDFLRGDVLAALDWRDNPFHPKMGGRYAVQLAQFRDRDLDSYDFHRVDIDLQQYIPLPGRYRTFAFRLGADLTEADAGQQVPFYYQPTLGGAQTLRGFREFRFRDQNALLLTAEYRWEAWWALDGALFVDAGTVATNRRDLSFSDMDVSYGIGFRFHSNSAVVGRLDLAFSREGFIPLLRFEHVF